MKGVVLLPITMQEVLSARPHHIMIMHDETGSSTASMTFKYKSTTNSGPLPAAVVVCLQVTFERNSASQGGALMANLDSTVALTQVRGKTGPHPSYMDDTPSGVFNSPEPRLIFALLTDCDQTP